MKRGATAWLDAFDSALLRFFELEPDVLILLDENGFIRRVNAAVLQYLDYAPGALDGVPLITLLAQGDLTRLGKAAHLASLGLPTEPLHLLRRGGSTIAVRLIRFQFLPQRRQTFLIFRPVEAP